MRDVQRHLAGAVFGVQVVLRTSVYGQQLVVAFTAISTRAAELWAGLEQDMSFMAAEHLEYLLHRMDMLMSLDQSNQHGCWTAKHTGLYPPYT
jgi:hypothetical protein